MVEEEPAALAKLELLSNTAVLKKVLDRDSGCLHAARATGEDQTRSASRVSKSTNSNEPSPFPGTEKHQQHYSSNARGTASSQRTPPVLTERPVYPFPHPLIFHPYHRYASIRNEDSYSQSEHTSYPTNWNTPHRYYTESRRDVVFGANRASPSGESPPPELHQRTKENLPPLQLNSFVACHEQGPLGGRIVEEARYPITRTLGKEEADSVMRSYDSLATENQEMRRQLKQREIAAMMLQQRIASLEKQISELRQLPTGKISHIPIDDMMRIMQEYGSEVSNQTLPKRKDTIKKASIVRQFRRWNPEFFRYFIHVNGEWVPKLGREGELKRRAEKRRMLKNAQHGRP